MSLSLSLSLSRLTLALALSCAASAHAAPSKEKIDALFAPWSGSAVPGCALGVTQNGVPAYQAGYGMADLEQGVANRPDTVFNIASLSKHFTTTAVELLVQEGKLSWGDDIRKYVPEIPDYGARITLRHLANHTSGLRDFLSLLELGGWNWVDAVTEERMLRVISRQKHLNFPTGSKYTYSNTGYVLLAIVVKRVTGQPLGQFAEERIFKPLGMLHTRIYDDRRMIWKNRAPGYYPREDGHGFAAWRPTYDQIIGDGAVLTSVQDMALWERNFLHPTLGPKPGELVAALETPGRLNDGKPARYGEEDGTYALGLVVGDYRGLRTVAHSGGIPGYATNMLLFPDQRLAVTVLCNQGGAPAADLTKAVADLYLDGQFKHGAPIEAPKPRGPWSADDASKATGTPASPLADYAGAYSGDEVDAVHRIAAAGSGLDLRVGDLPAMHFSSTGGDDFEGEGLVLHFVRDTGGRITGYTLDAGRVQGLVFVRQATQARP
jgi:CubicO group peptidase (beta-lactamase class C family)